MPNNMNEYFMRNSYCFFFQWKNYKKDLIQEDSLLHWC